MRGVLQRVRRAEIRVDGEPVGVIGRGVVLLVGVERGDSVADAEVLADKVVDLRIFPDDTGRPGRSVVDVGGAVAVVSQFTLAADVRRGRRPSFVRAAAPELAAPLVDAVVDRIAARGVDVAAGVFGAMMEVELVNDGPFTLVLDVVDGRLR
ncbi:MAG TPA: D-tyrosyl-tRNA(Tyr) deacylase [Actinobacteria bacterium]|nr:D-tyrosyl-tRNA(Tyr) deacylase [Actinomycetota bacterium]